MLSSFIDRIIENGMNYLENINSIVSSSFSFSKYIVWMDICYGVPFYIYLNNCIDHIIIYWTKECLNYTSFCGLHLPFASSCVTHPPKGSVYKWVRRKSVSLLTGIFMT